jgi:hypothetical protein
MVVTDRSIARPTLHCSSSEANVLGERQLQNRCALSLTLCSGAGLMPKVRTKKRPATQGVPLRREGRYRSFCKVKFISHSHIIMVAFRSNSNPFDLYYRDIPKCPSRRLIPV